MRLDRLARAADPRVVSRQRFIGVIKLLTNFEMASALGRVSEVMEFA